MAEINPIAASGTYLNSLKSSAATNPGSEFNANFWGDDGFSFGDILDLINPLQHLPIIGSLYRAATGDEISRGSSILGSGLFGGIIGVGIAVVNVIIEEVTGGEVIDHITALFEDEAPESTVLASAGNRYGAADASSRRARESTWIDTAPEEPVAAAAHPANTERHYASNPAFRRRDQEATMTTLVSSIAGPAAPAPLQAAPAVVEPPVTEGAARVMAMLETQKEPLATSQAPAWLAAMPRADTGFTDTAMRYMTSQAWLQLAQAMAREPENPPAGGSIDIPLDVIDRYNLRANNYMIAKPERINGLY